MINIDWSSILPVAAYITLGLMVGAFILVVGCLILGKAAANRRPHTIPETADEVIEFTGRPNYSGIRRSILRADEAARSV